MINNNLRSTSVPTFQKKPCPTQAKKDVKTKKKWKTYEKNERVDGALVCSNAMQQIQSITEPFLIIKDSFKYKPWRVL